VQESERIVREMVLLVRPGGWVASFEAALTDHTCDPPLPAWTRLLDVYKAYSATQGIDLFVGRRTHRLFRDTGVVDINVDAVVHVSIRRGMIGDRSCETSSTMFATI